MTRLYVGDLCPDCRWILTLRDFSLGRCGHCLRAVPIDNGATVQLDALRAATSQPKDDE